MNIPNSFKAAQTVFFDKTLRHYLPDVSTGSLGTKTVAPAQTATREILCNFRIISDAIKAQEYGLTVLRDATATIGNDPGVARGDYLANGSDYYRVVGVIQRDSHTKYLLKAVK